tara:strand:- start:355 stop:648 length:294 start_codon:yes stop_codon:yes gene_type:complete
MNKSIIYIVILKILFLLNFNSISNANISSNFIGDITNRASGILSSQDTKEVKIQELIKIGERSVDIDGIGFYTLGNHRKNLNDEQKTNLVKFLENIF